jgi:large subunit ribosomal protein L4
VLEAVGVGRQSCLISTAGVDRNVYLSGRNLPGAQVLPARELHAYAVLRPKKLVLTLQALQELRGPAASIAAAREEQR